MVFGHETRRLNTEEPLLKMDIQSVASKASLRMKAVSSAYTRLLNDELPIPKPQPLLDIKH